MDYSSIRRLRCFGCFGCFICFWWLWWFWWIDRCLKWCPIVLLFRCSFVPLFRCFLFLCSVITLKSTLCLYRVRLSACSRAYYPHRMSDLKHYASRWRASWHELSRSLTSYSSGIQQRIMHDVNDRDDNDNNDPNEY
jgi:hypothetical protein